MVYRWIQGGISEHAAKEDPVMTAQTTQDAQATSVHLKAMVKPDPYRPGPDRWRLVEYERPVWAIIQHMIAEGDIDDPTEASDELVALTAADYEIPEIAVRAALAYYEENRAAIDTRLAINAAATAKRQ